jgi:pilus assembly protein Flp/PilA
VRPFARLFAHGIHLTDRNIANSDNLMTTRILNLLASLHRDEAGQGLVEYMLIIALVAFGAVAGMNTLASYLNQAFSSIGSLVNVYIS